MLHRLPVARDYGSFDGDMCLYNEDVSLATSFNASSQIATDGEPTMEKKMSSHPLRMTVGVDASPFAQMKKLLGYAIMTQMTRAILPPKKITQWGCLKWHPKWRTVKMDRLGRFAHG